MKSEDTRTPKLPPPTRQDNVVETLHGVEIVDPFRWLEDQDSAETRAWIEAQNEYTQSILNNLPCRDKLEQRLTELLKVEVIGAPVARGDNYFLLRRSADQEQMLLYRRKGVDGPDELLLDPFTLYNDTTTNLSIADVTADGSIVAYSIRQGGEDEVELRLLDPETRVDLPDHLPKGRISGVSFTPDKRGFYYSKLTDNGPRVYFHLLGADSKEDAELFGEGYDRGKFIWAAVSEDGRYLLLVVYYGSAAQKTEVYVKNLIDDGPIMPIVTDIDARFTADIGGDHLFLLTNWNAPNGRVLRVDLTNPARERWCEIVPADADVIQGFSPVGGRVFVHYLHNVTSCLKEFTLTGEFVRNIPLPGAGTASALYGQWDRSEGFYTFTSFAAPTTIYRYDVATGRQEVWAQEKAALDESEFEIEQVFYPSKDGTKIPMFLLYAKGLKRDGTRPTLLTGYGGFNVSLTPSYSTLAITWAEQGGIFALANLRGGGEYGEQWHEAGMLNRKQNVFDDFIAGAEWLVRNNYTHPRRLAIMGGSNGGLLVGATLTQRPDLFQAVVCTYPLLDMLRYQKFLVASFWVPEYGSSDDPEQFKVLNAYSPYQHVVKGTKYPSVLFITGDADTRVAPLHARKMAALLQYATAAGPEKPILLDYDTSAGHSGGKCVSQAIRDGVDLLSYLFWQLGMTP